LKRKEKKRKKEERDWLVDFPNSVITCASKEAGVKEEEEEEEEEEEGAGIDGDHHHLFRQES